MKEIVTYKVCIMGAEAGGKTSLVRVALDSDFPSEYSPTIGGDYRKLTIENTAIEIWDTGGQHRFASLIPMYLKDAQAVIYCIDLSNKLDDAVLAEISIAKRMAGERAFILVGTKCDLPARVSQEELESLARTEGYKKVLMTSAKGRLNINLFVEYLHELAVEKHALERMSLTIRKMPLHSQLRQELGQFILKISSLPEEKDRISMAIAVNELMDALNSPEVGISEKMLAIKSFEQKCATTLDLSVGRLKKTPSFFNTTADLTPITEIIRVAIAETIVNTTITNAKQAAQEEVVAIPQQGAEVLSSQEPRITLALS
ncbi:Rho GTPase (Miro-like) (plasmid) [Legionella adelaidensis]|uniref:Rho GTPase (Miro-like) n=1 Tax=Legionella adelaidensis TaxID=45056 RepID=A0A0W0R5G9_9GAMM|nr:Rab family GTPase [Legionella adelaidensis]KTC66326.1 Rho GTPase (Miro-like) [Legionella adelaidensis]VEH84924.1 Rho GTPase (Miro-like) [Legionella adelaidensis]